MISNMLERVLGVLVFIIISPLFLIIAMIIELDSDGSILFTQERVGKNGKVFTIYKFRTLKINAPHNVPSEELETDYMTRVGSFLRKSSLDELPQIINIIKGDMSFVGYRPVIKEEEELVYLRKLYNIDDDLPGITGWAQINGRDEVSVDRKIQYEKYYYVNRSFRFDIYILYKTVFKVIKKEGIIY